MAPSLVHEPFAIALCWRRQFQEALEVIRGCRSQAFDLEFLKAYILLELHPQEPALAGAVIDDVGERCDRLMASDGPWSDLEEYRNLPLMSARTKEAAAAYRAAVQRLSPPKPWQRTYFDFGFGKATETELLHCTDLRWAQQCVTWRLALEHLAGGTEPTARRNSKRPGNPRSSTLCRAKWPTSSSSGWTSTRRI
jgi:hypothetical protein